jgi:putative SbcD/Mre11-related phosphoesterase
VSSCIPVLPGLFAHPSGALWIPESKTLLVADVHLGYSWAQRRRGELGPLADARTREKLYAVCRELLPTCLVFLGDLVHAPRPCAPERVWIEETLTQLAGAAELIVVRGNHDRAFAREFGHLSVKTVESWSNHTLTAIHGDRLITALPEHHILVIGHLHPAMAVEDAAGASRKLPLFLVTPHCIVMPAFSPFAGGYEVAAGLPDSLLPLFRNHEIEAVAVSGKRAICLGPLERAIERLQSSVTGPGQYQGRRRPPRQRGSGPL